MRISTAWYQPRVSCCDIPCSPEMIGASDPLSIRESMARNAWAPTSNDLPWLNSPIDHLQHRMRLDPRSTQRAKPFSIASPQFAP